MQLLSFLKLAAALYVIYKLADQVPLDRLFVFDPNVLHGAAKEAIAFKADNSSHRFAFLTQRLRQLYPRYVVDDPVWMFNNAGGAMGQMVLLHCSLTEYLIIFGTTMGTEGHSGRYLATDYFMILEGEQHAMAAGELEKRVFKPGELNVLRKGDAIQYKMPEKTFALEYARGIIPQMLPFGLIEVFTSTMDFWTLWLTLFQYAKLVVVNLLQGKI